MKFLTKFDKNVIFLVGVEILLILIIVYQATLNTKYAQENKNLELQILDKDETDTVKELESQLDLYRDTSEKREKASSEAITLVEDFLKEYYKSGSSNYTKLIRCEKFLSDLSLRKLCPYDNDPDEVSDDLLQKIRNHDQSLIDTTTNDIKVNLDNIDIYYRGDFNRKEQVFAYFTLETYKRKNSHTTSSTYIFECTVGEIDGKLLISDIILKSPVIIPTYNPELSNTH